MRVIFPVLIGLLGAAGVAERSDAATVYWNLFNIEGESATSAAYVTYDTLDDMVNDTNRTGLHEPNTPGFGKNVIGSDSDGTTWWNLFNIEGESAISAAYVTYASLLDMLNDTNRTGLYEPNSPGFGKNIIGSGSDGTTWWNLFNIEGESAISAAYVTYGSLLDMLSDTNRTGLYEPNSPGFGKNVVGSGSDGTTWWNLFNIEGESAISAAYVTYGSLDDMLNDINRTGLFEPNSAGFGKNVIGSGSGVSLPPLAPIPLPASALFFATAFAGLMALRRRAVKPV